MLISRPNFIRFPLAGQPNEPSYFTTLSWYDLLFSSNVLDQHGVTHQPGQPSTSA